MTNLILPTHVAKARAKQVKKEEKKKEEAKQQKSKILGRKPVKGKTNKEKNTHVRA